MMSYLADLAAEADFLEMEERVAFGYATVEEEMEVYLQELMERDD